MVELEREKVKEREGDLVKDRLTDDIQYADESKNF